MIGEPSIEDAKSPHINMVYNSSNHLNFTGNVGFDAIVVGAGFAGLGMLHKLRELGLKTRVIDTASDVGGTWYWNRYPGARTDSESWTYILNFSKEVREEWNWKERFATQDQVLGYLGFVADRFDMRKDIQFKTRVESAHYHKDQNHWTISTDQGDRYTCRYFIAGTGILSAGRKLPFPGVENFKGECYVTSEWPKEKISLAGKRVAVIGTGATGIQIIPVASHVAKSVTAFQRTPNYILPGRNYSVVDEEMTAIRDDYDEIWERARDQVFGFSIGKANRTMADVKDEAEVQRIFEAGYEAGGFRYVFETFDDIITNQASNDAASEFLRKKIRTIVKDPKTANLLCPRYPLLAKRPPLGHFYYEAFNRSNVDLVDISNHPIEEITPTGLRTSTTEYDFDVIIFAIGFDAVTGALTSMDIRGDEGQSLSENWSKQLETYLGILVEGFPNMFMITGPQAPFANMPVIIDSNINWIGRALSYMLQHGKKEITARRDSVERWCAHVKEAFEATLMATSSEQVRSWYVGANVPGKQSAILFYFGGAPAYLKHTDDEIKRGFSSLEFS